MFLKVTKRKVINVNLTNMEVQSFNKDNKHKDQKPDLFLWFQYLRQSLYLLSLVLSKPPSGTMAEPPFQLSLYNPENIQIKAYIIFPSF